MLFERCCWPWCVPEQFVRSFLRLPSSFQILPPLWLYQCSTPMQAWLLLILWLASGRSLCPAREKSQCDQRQEIWNRCVPTWKTCTFSEKVLYGLSIGWVLAFSSSASPYDQLFWIWKHKQGTLSRVLTQDKRPINETNNYICVVLSLTCSECVSIQGRKCDESRQTFSKAHLSCVYSAYLLMNGSSLSGMMVLCWRIRILSFR